MSQDISLLRCLTFNTKGGTSASVREEVSFCEHELADFARKLQGEVYDEHTGLFYLATCHRIELYFFVYPSNEVLSLWSEFKGASVHKGVLLQGAEALRHLLHVTSSVDSEVLGETQITGQVKDAAATAKQMGILKGPLERWIQQSLRIAKRVRNETELGRGTISVAHVAVDGTVDFFDSFEDKSALVIGSGTMAAQALERLQRLGVGRVTWVNRTREKLIEHPLSRDCQIADYEHRHQLCHEHEIIVAATSAPEAILTQKSLQAEKPAGRSKKRADTRLVLDLGLPRNVEEAIHGFEQFYVRNVDEFRDRADENSKLRQKAKESALKIIDEEMARSLEENALWDRGPLIGTLKTALGELFEEEIHNLKLEKTPQMEYITRGVQGKLLHKLLKELESLEADEALGVLRFLNRAWRRPETWLQNPKMDLVPDQPQKPLPQQKPNR